MTDTTIPATLPIDAWRYQDARGHFRYRGYRPRFDVAYPLLRPVGLTLQAPAQEALEALRAEVERKSDAVQRLWKERDELRAEVSRLTAERDAAREDARRLKDAGAPMANTMFNLAQRETMPIRERALLKDMQIRWDAAMNPSTQETK